MNKDKTSYEFLHKKIEEILRRYKNKYKDNTPQDITNKIDHIVGSIIPRLDKINTDLETFRVGTPLYEATIRNMESTIGKEITNMEIALEHGENTTYDPIIPPEQQLEPTLPDVSYSEAFNFKSAETSTNLPAAVYILDESNDGVKISQDPTYNIVTNVKGIFNKSDVVSIGNLLNMLEKDPASNADVKTVHDEFASQSEKTFNIINFAANIANLGDSQYISRFAGLITSAHPKIKNGMEWLIYYYLCDNTVTYNEVIMAEIVNNKFYFAQLYDILIDSSKINGTAKIVRDYTNISTNSSIINILMTFLLNFDGNETYQNNSYRAYLSSLPKLRYKLSPVKNLTNDTFLGKQLLNEAVLNNVFKAISDLHSNLHDQLFKLLNNLDTAVVVSSLPDVNNTDVVKFLSTFDNKMEEDVQDFFIKNCFQYDVASKKYNYQNFVEFLEKHHSSILNLLLNRIDLNPNLVDHIIKPIKDSNPNPIGLVLFNYNAGFGFEYPQIVEYIFKKLKFEEYKYYFDYIESDFKNNINAFNTIKRNFIYTDEAKNDIIVGLLKKITSAPADKLLYHNIINNIMTITSTTEAKNLREYILNKMDEQKITYNETQIDNDTLIQYLYLNGLQLKDDGNAKYKKLLDIITDDKFDGNENKLNSYALWFLKNDIFTENYIAKLNNIIKDNDKDFYVPIFNDKKLITLIDKIKLNYPKGHLNHILSKINVNTVKYNWIFNQKSEGLKEIFKYVLTQIDNTSKFKFANIVNELLKKPTPTDSEINDALKDIGTSYSIKNINDAALTKLKLSIPRANILDIAYINTIDENVYFEELTTFNNEFKLSNLQNLSDKDDLEAILKFVIPQKDGSTHEFDYSDIIKALLHNDNQKNIFINQVEIDLPATNDLKIDTNTVKNNEILQKVLAFALKKDVKTIPEIHKLIISFDDDLLLEIYKEADKTDLGNMITNASEFEGVILHTIEKNKSFKHLLNEVENEYKSLWVFLNNKPPADLKDYITKIGVTPEDSAIKEKLFNSYIANINVLSNLSDLLVELLNDDKHFVAALMPNLEKNAASVDADKLTIVKNYITYFIDNFIDKFSSYHTLYDEIFKNEKLYELVLIHLLRKDGDVAYVEDLVKILNDNLYDTKYDNNIGKLAISLCTTNIDDMGVQKFAKNICTKINDEIQKNDNILKYFSIMNDVDVKNLISFKDNESMIIKILTTKDATNKFSFPKLVKKLLSEAIFPVILDLKYFINFNYNKRKELLTILNNNGDELKIIIDQLKSIGKIDVNGFIDTYMSPSASSAASAAASAASAAASAASAASTASAASAASSAASTHVTGGGNSFNSKDYNLLNFLSIVFIEQYDNIVTEITDIDIVKTILLFAILYEINPSSNNNKKDITNTTAKYLKNIQDTFKEITDYIDAKNPGYTYDVKPMLSPAATGGSSHKYTKKYTEEYIGGYMSPYVDYQDFEYYQNQGSILGGALAGGLILGGCRANSIVIVIIIILLFIVLLFVYNEAEANNIPQQLSRRNSSCKPVINYNDGKMPDNIHMENMYLREQLTYFRN